MKDNGQERRKKQHRMKSDKEFKMEKKEKELRGDGKIH